MTPTDKMLQIEESRQRLLNRNSGKIMRECINEAADELHKQEMKRYKATQHVGDIAKDLLKLIQAQNEGRKENENGK